MRACTWRGLDVVTAEVHDLLPVILVRSATAAEKLNNGGKSTSKCRPVSIVRYWCLCVYVSVCQ